THKRTHSGERPYACDEPGCDFRGAIAGRLKTHKCTHSGERPYACDEPGCGYSAAADGNLERHKRTHSGARGRTRTTSPGASTGQLRRATSRATSARTAASSHTRCKHSGERPYVCDEPGCEYRAAETGTLKKHKRTHSSAA
ncbi:hypothetical protein T492DRAFT_861383, partial [Pavlovales sp. CCMP2436]